MKFHEHVDFLLNFLDIVKKISLKSARSVKKKAFDVIIEKDIIPKAFGKREGSRSVAARLSFSFARGGFKHSWKEGEISRRRRRRGRSLGKERKKA